MRALPVIVALAACRMEQTIVAPDPQLDRMLKQEKVVAYDNNPLLPAGMSMQKPPDGTTPIDAFAGRSLVAEGAEAGRFVERPPIRVDRRLVEVGRERFDTFCATCHGILGDGVSVVAEKMALRRPPSLHEARIRAYPAGRIYKTIRQGYGLMPAYAVQLSIEESWGVTAYVRTLQLSRNAIVAELPPAVLGDLAREAP
jgi:mono/diheme cytochrome c family protein